MLVCRLVRLAAGLSATDESLLQQVRFHHIDQGVHFLIEGGRNSLHTDRPSLVQANDSRKEVPIQVVQTDFVNSFQIQCAARNLGADLSGAFHLREVADAPQQAISYARRTSRPASDFRGPGFIYLGTQNARRTNDDLAQFLDCVKLQVIEETEPIP